ncbi:MAG: MgtC/SapB family protein [Actinobacteria bacterium]|nr:MgtC/SapB family protein [Actinomycetota bacterium]
MDLEPFIRLLIAAALTAFIGIDRELRAKPAGLRTNIVVGIATAAFAYAGSLGFIGGDPTRVAAQIVSGIGFLGGGAIFASAGKPHGLTTAAALWGSAAIGLAAGIGEYSVAVAVVLVTLIALWPLDLVAQKALSSRVRHDMRIHVVLERLDVLPQVQRRMADAPVEVLDLELRSLQGELIAELTLAGRLGEVTAAITRIEGVPGVRLVAGQSSYTRADD